jgi:hypothetical protein
MKISTPTKSKNIQPSKRNSQIRTETRNMKISTSGIETGRE